MLGGAILTGAFQKIFLSGDKTEIIKVLLGYAIMGAGLFLAKRSFGTTFEIKQFVFAAGVVVAGAAINGVFFKLINGDMVTYVKYFAGVAALTIGGWIGKHSFGGDDGL